MVLGYIFFFFYFIRIFTLSYSFEFLLLSNSVLMKNPTQHEMLAVYQIAFPKMAESQIIMPLLMFNNVICVLVSNFFLLNNKEKTTVLCIQWPVSKWL